MKKAICVILITLMIMGTYKVERATATPLVMAPAMISLICAIGAYIGIDAMTDDGKAGVATSMYESFTQQTKNNLQQAIDLAQAGVETIVISQSLLDDFINGRDLTLEKAEAGTPIEVQTQVAPDTVLSTGFGTVDIPVDKGHITFYSNCKGENQVRKTTISATNAWSIILYQTTLKASPQPYEFQTKWEVRNASNQIVAQAILESITTVYQGGGFGEAVMASQGIGMSIINGMQAFYVNGSIVFEQAVAPAIVFNTIASTDTDTTEHLSCGYGLAGEPREVVLQQGTDYEALTAIMENQALITSLLNQSLALDTGTGATTVSPVLPQSALNDIGSMTGILANIYTLIGTLTATVQRFFDLSQPINVEPLKLVGTTLTTAFPFSLPWDIQRSFSSLSSTTAWDGHIPIQAHSTLANFDFDLNFDWFADILPIVRLFELLAFDVGLILATRKLLGGAS